MTASITISDKKEAITITVDGTITMTGSNPYSRVHVHGTQGVTHAQDGPVTVKMDDTVTISWGVIGKHGIYENRPIVLKRVDDAIHVTYRALFTVVVTEPVTYTLYRYDGEWRYRKEP